MLDYVGMCYEIWYWVHFNEHAVLNPALLRIVPGSL